MRSPKLLLVTPTFHGYWRPIAAAFEQSGFGTQVVLYDELPGWRSKLHNKVLAELPDRMGLPTTTAATRATRKAIDAVSSFRPQRVVVIKGDVLQPRFWETLNRERIPHLLWLYDERRRMRYSDEQLKSIGTVVSYSHDDVSDLVQLGVHAGFVANAFDPILPFTPVPSEAVVFVGARHANREQAMIALHAAGIPVLAHGREWSRHWFDRLRTWEVRRPDLPSGRDIPLNDAFGHAAGALATLNMHQNQDGFTMRTFEVPGVGGLQLIDRADVHEFYEPGKEVLCFSTLEELIELAHRARRDQSWADSVRAAGQRRTLAEHTFLHRVRTVLGYWS